MGFYNRKHRRDTLSMFHALRDVSLEIQAGERVALVGRNGAGKTTLLKLLMGNFAPSDGSLRVRGHVLSLMSGVMGESMNPGFSGLENLRIKLRGGGYSGKRFDDALEEAVDFVELGEFLHQPLSTYSLGMAARLAFAAATAISPEILLIDEVLGAGDSYFLEKCARRIEKITDQGCTLVLVSHSTQQLLRFCKRGIWLRDHTVYMDGPAYEVLQRYDADVEWSAELGRQNASGEAVNPERLLGEHRSVLSYPGKKGVKVADCWFESPDGKAAAYTCSSLEPVSLGLELVAEIDIAASLRYIITFWSPRGLRAATLENTVDKLALRQGERRTVHFSMERCLLEPGSYPVNISIYDVSPTGLTSDVPQDGRHDVVVSALELHVRPSKEREGFSLPGAWT